MLLLIPFRVSGHSMEPTFTSGQIVLVSSIPYFFREPKVGDVIVVKDPHDDRLLLKRIIERDSSAEGFRMTYTVSGDNRGHSRTFGPVPRKQIVGKLILKLNLYTVSS